MKALNRILNSRNRVKRRGKKTFVVDATPVDLDFNFNRNKKTKEYLKTLNLKWSYSSSKGFYIGFKATVVIDFDSMNPVCILIHSGPPSDAKLFDEIMEHLQKRRIIEKGDILIFDKVITAMKTIKLELANIKSFLSFFQETISKEINSMTNYPIHYKHLRKQRKL
jgi:hypothetical protein